MSIYTVRCEDGNVRHAEPFATRREAEVFAEWGHCCTARHTIEADDAPTTRPSGALVYGPDTWYGFNARGEHVGTFPHRWSAEQALAQRSVVSISPAVQPGA